LWLQLLLAPTLVAPRPSLLAFATRSNLKLA
jgi:hypothetical protein